MLHASKVQAGQRFQHQRRGAAGVHGPLRVRPHGEQQRHGRRKRPVQRLRPAQMKVQPGRIDNAATKSMAAAVSEVSPALVTPAPATDGGGGGGRGRSSNKNLAPGCCRAPQPAAASRAAREPHMHRSCPRSAPRLAARSAAPRPGCRRRPADTPPAPCCLRHRCLEGDQPTLCDKEHKERTIQTMLNYAEQRARAQRVPNNVHPH